MATKKTNTKTDSWVQQYPVGMPDQYVLGAYTIVCNDTCAVLKDGCVIGYAATLDAAKALAEADAKGNK